MSKCHLRRANKTTFRQQKGQHGRQCPPSFRQKLRRSTVHVRVYHRREDLSVTQVWLRIQATLTEGGRRGAIIFDFTSLPKTEQPQNHHEKKQTWKEVEIVLCSSCKMRYWLGR